MAAISCTLNFFVYVTFFVHKILRDLQSFNFVFEILYYLRDLQSFNFVFEILYYFQNA